MKIIANKQNHGHKTVEDAPKIAENAINYGIKVLIIFAIIFLGWATLLPIKSASIADGAIILDFNRKNIQHLEGGIIDQILVKEGQIVNKGDILLYIRDIKVKSEQQILKEKLWTMQLQKERLRAEKDNKITLNFSNFFSEVGELSDSDKAKIQEIIAGQIKIFRSKKGKRYGEIEVLKKKLTAVNIRLDILEKELEIIKPLVEEGNLPLLREMELQKSITQAAEESKTTELQIANYQNNDSAEILREIKEIDMEIIALYNQLAASQDVLERSAITSPVSGKIMNIKYHTIGAVVPPGGEIMSIVPQNDELIIEAKVKPQDIDNIAIGMKSKIQLTAYKGKKVPKLNGSIINISPDIVNNEQTRESYFLARIAIDKQDIEKLKTKIELYPGMPAQIFIITGSRSLVSYMFTPISESTYKAFREE